MAAKATTRFAVHRFQEAGYDVRDVRKDVETSGATYVAQDAVRDGRYVSAPTWIRHPAFNREVFRCLND